MIKSAAIFAIGLFACANFMANPYLQSLDENIAHSTLQRFEQLQAPAKVVFLGSSLNLCVYRGLDQDTIKKESIGNLTCLVQRPSDSFLLIQQYLQGNNKPDRVIMGLGPRDFFDNDCPPINRTVTYKRLVPMSLCLNDLPMYAPNFNDAAYTITGRLSPLFSDRALLQTRVIKHENAIRGLFGYKGDPLPKTRPEGWAHSIKEYKWRYRGISMDGMESQMAFLQRSLDLCKERNIHVEIVNLPLSADNLRLLPAGLTEQFRDRLVQMCRRNSADFVDAADTLKLSDADFCDCVHLNSNGASQVLKLIFAPKAEKTQLAATSANAVH
jgi:hypothetical protein